MRLFVCLLAAGFLAVTCADDSAPATPPAVPDDPAVPVEEEVVQSVEERFVTDVEDVLKNNEDNDDDNDDDDDNSGNRNRRSAAYGYATGSGLGLLSPTAYRRRGLGYYSDVAPVRVVSGYYNDAPLAVGGFRRGPAFGGFRTGGPDFGAFRRGVPAFGGFRRFGDAVYGGERRGSFFRAVGNDDDRFSFVRFYNSFRPLRAVLRDGNVYVKNYVRRGSFDDCLSDFRRLRLSQVKAITSTTILDNNNFGLLSGVRRVAASEGLFGKVERDATVGYVGVLRDFPYQVYAMREGCRVDGYNGYHDCIVFSGATYPFTKTIRRFVYINGQSSAAAAVDTVDRVVADRYIRGGFGSYAYRPVYGRYDWGAE